MSGRGRGRGGDRGRDESSRSRGGDHYRGRGGDGPRGRGGDGPRGRGGDGPRGRGGTRGPKKGIAYSPADGRVPPPDPKVQQKENELHPVLIQTKSPAKLPLRPGFGTKGNPVLLFTNFFELIAEPNLLLYRYDISIEPLGTKQLAITGKKLNQLVKQLLQTDQFADREDDLVTDFRSNIIARERLFSQEFDQVIQYVAENEDEPAANAPRFRVRVQETGVLTVSQLTDFLTSSNISQIFDDKEPIRQALNIFLRHYAKESKSIATVGTAKSFPLNPNAASDQAYNLGAGLKAIRGIFSSVRVATCRILVNINVTAAAFYDPIRLDQLIGKYGFPRVSRIRVNGFLKRLRVEVNHLPPKKNKAGVVVPRIKTIFGLATKNDGTGDDASGPPPKVQEFGAGSKGVQFFLRDQAHPVQSPDTKKAGGRGKKAASKPDPSSSSPGRFVSVHDYFKEQYNLTVVDPGLPVINVGNRANPSYLPAQCCRVLPGQSSQSTLSGEQSKAMIKHAVREPFKNAASIVNEGPSIVGLSPQTNIKLSQFGISVPTKLLTVHGRVLKGPTVYYRGDQSVNPYNGSWNMINIRLNKAASLPPWSYLTISTRQQPDAYNQASLSGAVKRFSEVLRGMGIGVPSPTTPGSQIMINHPGELQSKIEDELRKAARQIKFLLIIVPDSKDKVMYNKIKHAGDVKFGIHTQCVFAANFGKGESQYLANVGLKVNLKFDGVNQLVEKSRLGIIEEKNTMVVGIDVTHPSPSSSSGAPSIAAMVASIDSYLGQWPADLRIQKRRQEMVTDLDKMLKTRLALWKRSGKNATLPENILVYRDGVSESQYEEVIEKELPLLKQACSEMYPAQDTKKGLPKFSIIIVGKRHHTRFYPTTNDSADQSHNPQNGTVVDRGVTEARNWDFFLQAHSAIKGTARPAHYYVVFNEIFTRKELKPPFQTIADVLEDLTHSMSYLHGRATNSVSLCPPAYYADIVCERARRYLSNLFEQSTPSGTLDASSTGGGAGGSRSEDVLIHPSLKDTMFYI